MSIDTHDLWDDFVHGGTANDPDRFDTFFYKEDEPIGALSPADAEFFFRSNRFDSEEDPAPGTYNGKGLKPWSKITNRLFVGGDDYQTDPDVLTALLRRGVTDVLDCRTEWEVSRDMQDESWTRAPYKLRYCTNLTDDDGKAKPIGYFETAVAWGESVLARSNSVMYVHCAMGINRGPSNAYAILRGCFGMDSKTAMTVLRRGRPQAGAVYWPDANAAIARLSERD